LKKIFLKDRNEKLKIPEVQRELVWPMMQQQLLVDSVLRGYDIPKIYLRKKDNSDDIFEIYDGQQRISTLIGFMKDEFALASDMDPVTLEDGNLYAIAGLQYSQLDEDLVVELESYSFTVVMLEHFSKDEAEEMFTRLQLGVSLNPAEKRRAIPGNMRYVVRDLAKHDIFGKTGFISIPKKRRGHEDAVAKLLHQFMHDDLVSIAPGGINDTYRRNSDIDENHPDVKKLKQAMNFVNSSFTASTPPGLKKFSFLSLLWVIDELIRDYNLNDFKDEFARAYIGFENARIKDRENEETNQNNTYIEYVNAARGDSGANMQFRVETLRTVFFEKIPDLKRKDEQREFTHDQRLVLFRLADKKCTLCECEITFNNFHADHVLPHSRGGPTAISNGRALCADCNQSRGNRETN